MKPNNSTICICIMLLNGVVGFAQSDFKQFGPQQKLIVQHQKIDSVDRAVFQLKSRTTKYTSKELSLSRVKDRTKKTMVSGIIMATGGAILFMTMDFDDVIFGKVWKPFAIINGGGLFVTGLIITSYNANKLDKLNKDAGSTLGFGAGKYGIGMVITIQ